ncbi:hypothetical protein PR202_ga08410 [Eleusine coracana subsp. coracana]|uniref:F-box domain-containing protein n=1 Tax=Eleusine coracana subsp. coracana TaxID=191504 RepID=A0AAV5C1C4_ELECO|nr:hypothetical protein QOZ80_1AG0045470 [Eleusine coracana subsp. coracana]GJM91987.1 hypothetical protein PR202_ga08410 [Eleusine coracana subsp. coracana]
MASTAADGGTTDRAAVLPEDILFEIFSRVQEDARDLLCCAFTCKPWLRLFTDRSFLLRLWPDHGHGHRRLLGFFFQKNLYGNRKMAIKKHARRYYSVSAPTFLPTPGSPLGPGERAITSFVADDDGAFSYAEPVASRNGFVLMRIMPRKYHKTKGQVVFGLCNPITGERHVTPPLDCACHGHCVNGYAILMDADHSPSSGGRHSAFSQLLLTGYHDDDGHVHLHVYSAATRSWSALTTRCHSAFLLGADDAHWLYYTPRYHHRPRLYILGFEVTTARVSFTELPFSFNFSAGWSSSFLCVSRDGNRLSVASVYAMQVDVWTQQDGGDDNQWLCTQGIKIPPKVRHPEIYTYSRRRKCSFLNRGSLLALYECDNIFVVDIESNDLERVMVCPESLLHNAYGTCVPLEVDILEFFIVRLGGLSQG